MKTVMVLMAGAMMLSAGNGPGMEERARVKYGRTPTAAVATPSGAVALSRAEQWNRAKFGRVGGITPARVKDGGKCSHACCAHGE